MPMTAAQTLTEKRDVQAHIAPEILSSSTYRGGLGSKWARTNALIRIPSQRASERERLNVQILGASLGSSTGFPYMSRNILVCTCPQKRQQAPEWVLAFPLLR